MKLILVGIKDTAVQAILQPTIHAVRATGHALRDFTDAVNDPGNKQFHNHAQDFELWQLAELDDQDGTVTSKPERLARGQDLKTVTS